MRVLRTWIAWVLFLCCSCTDQPKDRTQQNSGYRKTSTQPVIHLMFFKDFTSNREDYEIRLRQQVKKYFKADLIVDRSQPLPASAYYKLRGRYRADSLLRFLRRNYRVIGVTSKDISTTKGPHNDWGIMGLAVNPGNQCVVSLYRTKTLNRLVPVSLHELAHTYGLPHCRNSACWMHVGDVSTKELDKQVDFCSECRKKLNGLIN